MPLPIQIKRGTIAPYVDLLTNRPERLESFLRVGSETTRQISDNNIIYIFNKRAKTREANYVSQNNPKDPSGIDRSAKPAKIPSPIENA
jgi:hypothetical protein